METTEATEWTPAEDFDTGLTADDWKEILEDKYFQDKKPIGLITLWLYYKYNTPCSYTELAKEYGRSRGFYSGGMTQFNYELSSKFKDKIHLFADNKGKDVYWYLPFVARKASKKKGEDGSSIFKLREEVREGFNKLSEERRQEFEQMYLEQKKKVSMNNETNVELNSKEQECLEKLKKSHQIILTGAPGTGKSYAAHEIANELTGNKAENIEFVQFHPSMDYTDFVEGLRPIKDNNGQIGFERQDGIFKAFCKRALKNWQTAQKSEEKQREERSIEQQLDTFLNDAVNEEKEFKLGRGSPFTIQYSQNDNDDKIYPKSVKDIIKNEPEKISYTQLLTLLKERPNITSINDITAFFYRKVSRQSDSYLFSLYNGITKWMENNKPQISVPDQKEELENFVFIIDEINRGDISKIFGELFFAIDPSYRGKKGKITTQYQNLVESDDLYADGFYIPENVYIIGTMNDIDRGVESMDFAIRRRFTWIEVDPNDTQSMLDSEIPEYAADAKERMGALNKVISTNPSLGKPYQIGAAYFLRLNELNGDFDALWAYHLEPLLLEYLRGDPRAEEFLDEMKKTYGVEAE